MPTRHDINNYTFEEADSGELTISHGTDGDIATYDPATGTFTSDKPFDTEYLNNAALVKPDGTNDAQKVIDTINDRPNDQAVVIIDPGISLDWEQQVDLPADEREFKLYTIGQPILNIQSGFSGNYAIRKPPNATSQRRYEIGPLVIRDTNDELTFGIQLNDIKEAVVWPVQYTDCPGIEINPENDASVDNWLINQRGGGGMGSAEGPAVALRDTGTAKANSNTIQSPWFNEHDKTTQVETAFVDEANNNRWLDTRAEYCHTVHEVSGESYYIREGNWDRFSDYDYTVKEDTANGGHIVVNHQNKHQRCRITSPTTVIDVGAGWSTDGRFDGGDLLGRVGRSAAVDGLSDLGLRDNSSGGSVSLSPRTVGSRIDLNTGSTTDQTAIVDMGGGSFVSRSAAPKLVAPIQYANAGDDSSVVVRVGIRQNDNNFAELVYDPGNTLADFNHDSSNWFFDVQTGGSNEGSVDTGVSPPGSAGTEQILAISRIGRRVTNPIWSAWIEGTEAEIVPGSDFTFSDFRVEVVTTEGSAKEWQIGHNGTPRLFAT